jgi:hypothetical protein
MDPLAKIARTAFWTLYEKHLACYGDEVITLRLIPSKMINTFAVVLQSMCNNTNSSTVQLLSRK